MKHINFSNLLAFGFRTEQSFQNFSYPEHELIFFKTGSGEITMEGQVYPYAHNHILFVEANTPRSQITTQETAYYCLRFQGEDLPLSSQCLSVNSPRIYELCKSVEKEHRDKNMGYHEICNLYIQEILLLLTRIQGTDQDTNSILHIVKAIDKNPSFDQSVEEMAHSVHYSYDYFRHKFKSLTGKSPAQYVMDSKINHACFLLNENQLNCTEIAYLLGFTSSSHFSKSFKKKTGTSPRNYKKIMDEPEHPESAETPED